MPGKLIVAGWHIGNISDLPNRTREALKSSDMILCEEVSDFIENCKRDQIGHIDNVKGILDFNDMSMHNDFVNYLNEGKTITLVCYEGMPTIADPGHVLVQIAHLAGILVDVVPGPVAPVSCLAMSGFFTEKFLIEKQPAETLKDKIEYFENLKDFDGSIILFEGYGTILDALRATELVFKNTKRIGVFINITMADQKVIIGTPDYVLSKCSNLTLYEETKITLIVNGKSFIQNSDGTFGD
jgi:16S rRNA (cytidine1402-2'-O)-methyltransferase